MIILFDLDGTLIDSTEAILEGFAHSFDVHNHPHPTDEAIKALIGHPLDVMFEELGTPQNSVWDFVATYKEYYRKISTQKTQLLPQAKEAVKLAGSFAQLGIVTTKTGKYSKVLMEHFELMHYFDVLIGREDVMQPKPDAEPIVKALNYFENFRKDEVWMIGDTDLDLLSATNAGVQAIGVLSGYGDLESLNKHKKVIYDNVYDAVAYLKRTIET
jgi:phosphoglycolate phosphatase